MDKDRRFEVENRTGQNLEGSSANRPLHRLSSSSIVGDDVKNMQGEDLGSIKDLMIDLHKGQIEYAVLQFGGFLGIGSKYFAIPWRELRIDTDNRNFILHRDKEFLKNAPGFDKDHWPGTNSEYYNDTNTYWGTTNRDRDEYRNQGSEFRGSESSDFNRGSGVNDPIRGRDEGDYKGSF
jgi:sporulation protein YlmC with PRC-barrel domain